MDCWGKDTDPDAFPNLDELLVDYGFHDFSTGWLLRVFISGRDKSGKPAIGGNFACCEFPGRSARTIALAS